LVVLVYPVNPSFLLSRESPIIDGDRLISRFMAEPDINGKTFLVRMNP